MKQKWQLDILSTTVRWMNSENNRTPYCEHALGHVGATWEMTMKGKPWHLICTKFVTKYAVERKTEGWILRAERHEQLNIKQHSRAYFYIV